MSKILINNGATDIFLSDTGVTVSASSQYTIPPQDYPAFAASSNTIQYLSTAELILNDGSNDILSVSQAVDILKGWCPSPPSVDDAAVGATTQYVGAVDTIPVLIPDTPADIISTCLIRCPAQTPNTRRLSYSIDGGGVYHTLAPGEFIGWSLRGAQTQISIVGNISSVNYEVTLNTVPS